MLSCLSSIPDCFPQVQTALVFLMPVHSRVYLEKGNELRVLNKFDIIFSLFISLLMESNSLRVVTGYGLPILYSILCVCVKYYLSIASICTYICLCIYTYARAPAFLLQIRKETIVPPDELKRLMAEIDRLEPRTQGAAYCMISSAIGKGSVGN